ncbi:MAG: hypothetical protein ACOYKM_04955 [Caulobacterales bacterium]
MERVQRYRQTVANILIACAAFVGALVGLMQDALQMAAQQNTLDDVADKIASNQAFGLAASIFFVMLFGFIAFGAAYVLFDRWRFLRRLVLGRHDIEGYWFDALIDQNGQPRGYGYINISVTENGPHVEGWSLDEQGRETGHFVSKAAEFDNFILTFIYSKVTAADIEDMGLSRFVFSTNDGRPNRYSGDFISRQSPLTRTSAIRIEDKLTVKTLRSTRPTQQQIAALCDRMHRHLGITPAQGPTRETAFEKSVGAA